MGEIEHYPWCAAAQNAARPRSQQLIGPMCECVEHRKGIEAAKELSPMLGLRLELTAAEEEVERLKSEPTYLIRQEQAEEIERLTTENTGMTRRLDDCLEVMTDRAIKISELTAENSDIKGQRDRLQRELFKAKLDVDTLTAERSSTVRQLKELREWLGEGSHHYRVTAYNTVNQMIARLESASGSQRCDCGGGHDTFDGHSVDCSESDEPADQRQESAMAKCVTGRLPAGTIVKIQGIPFELAYPTLVDASASSYKLAGIEQYPTDARRQRESCPNGHTNWYEGLRDHRYCRECIEHWPSPDLQQHKESK